jgi:hypothetical protein
MEENLLSRRLFCILIAPIHEKLIAYMKSTLSFSKEPDIDQCGWLILAPNPGLLVARIVV